MDPDQKPAFLQKYKFTLISLLVIILAAIPLLLLSNTSSKQGSKMTTQMGISPTSAPLTLSNAEPTLTQADADMQTVVTQVDLDLQSVSSVDASKDAPTGL